MNINFPLLFAGFRLANNWVWLILPLVTIPALVLGIVPFIRLNKKRRTSPKHLIPFIIHMVIIVVLTVAAFGISWVSTHDQSDGNIVMFVVDMSDSNAPTADEMNDYIYEVATAAHKADKTSGRDESEWTKFGLVVFGGPTKDNNGIIATVEPGELEVFNYSCRDCGKVYSKSELNNGRCPKASCSRKIDEETVVVDILSEYENTDLENPRNESNVMLGIESARSLISGKKYLENKKKIILLSDGKETEGVARNAMLTLADDQITLDCAYFDFTNSGEEENKYTEVQVISLSTNGKVKLGQEVEATVVLRSTKHINGATITLKDVAGIEITTVKDLVIPQGQSTHRIKFVPRRYNVDTTGFTNSQLYAHEAVTKTGVQAISVEVTAKNDLLPLNNTYSSWYTFETQGEILIVYGDGSQLTQIKDANILLMDQSTTGESSSRGIIKSSDGDVYSVTTVSATAFPDTLEKMLVYDEIVLMNVDFNVLGQASGADPQKIAKNIKRYVEEVGRGLLFTAGDHIYDYKDEYKCDEESCGKTMTKGELVDGKCPYCNNTVNNQGSFVDSPINEILPIDLKVDEEKETVAMVIVVDLSSSMKELVANSGFVCKTCNTFYEKKPEDGECKTCDKKTNYSSPTRYHVVLESVKKVITESKFAPEDYVGVVVFDQDYHVALEIQQIGDEENRKLISEKMAYEFEHYYYAHYIDNATGEDSDIRINFDKDGQPGSGNKYVDKIDGEEPKYSLPTSNYQDGGKDKATGDFIRSRGTSYKWPVQEASAMLARASNITSIEIKQVIFMSDGAPNDKGSGYEGIVERMAKGGTVTSTIAIGTDEAAGISELEKISVAGRGKLFLVQSAKDLDEDLTEITDSIQGKLFNEDITVQPMRDSLNSLVHTGVRDYDEIHGYYGTTIKEDAERVIYVDNLRPLYSEWEFGLGKVCALMTDLGNPDWTGEMFDDGDDIENIRLIQNILLSPVHERVDSTGLQYAVKRTAKSMEITVTTYDGLDLDNEDKTDGRTNYKEIIVATAYKFNNEAGIWEMHGSYNASRVANLRYQIDIPTKSIEETYIVILNITKVEVDYDHNGREVYTTISYQYNKDDPVKDATALAVVGKTIPEYDVLTGEVGESKATLSSLVTSEAEGLLVESNPKLVGRLFGKELVNALNGLEDLFEKENREDVIQECIDLAKNGQEDEAYQKAVNELDKLRLDGEIDRLVYEQSADSLTEKGICVIFRPKLADFTEIEKETNINILLVLLAILLFLIDILFRSFMYTKKKKAKREMTEDERLDSMRGR